MWYFDSWAVLDGQAFVSDRSADSIDAKATVFMSVPDLEPVPIGRISTALRAQRACFQDGFRDPDTSEEFAFDNLDQVREVIRRAYLGGGLAPVPTPIEGPPVSPFRTEYGEVPEPAPSRSGGEYYDEAVQQIFDDIWPQNAFDLRKDFEGLRDLSDRTLRHEQLLKIHSSTDRLEGLLRAFAEATLLEVVHENIRVLHLPEHRELIAQWAIILESMGLSFGEETWVSLGVGDVMGEILSSYRRSQGLPFDKRILFRIPCPLRQKWFPLIQSLGHKMLLPLATSDYFENNNELPELIPALFCAMVVVLAPDVIVARPGRLQRGDMFRLVGRACEWLERELPRVELPTGVEAELTNFAWKQISQNRDRSQLMQRGENQIG